MTARPAPRVLGSVVAVGVAAMVFVVGVAGLTRANHPIHLSTDGPVVPGRLLPGGGGNGAMLGDSGSDPMSEPAPGATTAPLERRSNGSPVADRLYRDAQAAMLRGDLAQAITRFDRVAHRFPGTPYATSALYYRGFLQYRQYRPGDPTPLRLALMTLRQLRRAYPSAPQNADAQTLETRICGELARLGDSACRQQVVTAAAPLHIWAKAVPPARKGQKTAGPGNGPPRSGRLQFVIGGEGGKGGFRVEGGAAAGDTVCRNDKQIDEWITTLSSLWKADSSQAMQATGQVLSNRGHCLTRLRSQAILMLTQRSTPVMAMAPVVFDAARNDPSPEVRQQAKMWLLSQQWEPDAAKFLHSIFGDDFQAKTTATR